MERSPERLWYTFRHEETLESSQKSFKPPKIPKPSTSVHIQQQKINHVPTNSTGNSHHHLKLPTPNKGPRSGLHALPSSPLTITEEEVVKVIKETKMSKVLGPDNLAIIMLRHIGPKGILLICKVS